MWVGSLPFLVEQITRVSKMRSFSNVLVASSVFGGALAQAPKPDSQGRYTLVADGIKAQFIEYGATLTNLWVKGR